DAACALLALPVALASGYLAFLAAVARRALPPAPVPPRLRFDVVVPAHDEEATVAETVQSLLRLDYPSSLVRVLVVADNCSDRTAEAAARAGAGVLVRRDAARPGKGHALAFASELLRRVPHRACSIVEDVEYGVALGLAGHRVHYAAEASVLGEMPASGAAARPQRRRWEAGRAALARRQLPKLLALGIQR